MAKRAKRKREEDDGLLKTKTEELEAEFNMLTPYEKRLAMRSMRELRERGKSSTLESVWQADFFRKPVLMGEFLDNDYFLGKQTEEMFPKIRGELEDIFRIDTPVQEVILGGSIGYGKTTLAAFGMLYLLYYLSCLRDPHKFYGLTGGSNIVLGIYSVTKTQAYDSSYAKMRTFIDESPYFRENFPRVQRIKSKIVFHNGAVQIIAGSQELHAIGLDMYAFLLDEANFLRGKNQKDDGDTMAMKIYNNAKRRMKCLAEDTLILTPDGNIPIKELDKSSSVDIITSDGKSMYSVTCQGAVYSGEEECFEVTLDNGQRVTARADHRFLVRCTCSRVRWVCLRDLKEDDDVVTQEDTWERTISEGETCMCKKTCEEFERKVPVEILRVCPSEGAMAVLERT